MIDTWAPQLILVSAGFDAHEADPLASMALLEEDYAWATRDGRDVMEPTQTYRSEQPKRHVHDPRLALRSKAEPGFLEHL
jgi:hypothetical protein